LKIDGCDYEQVPKNYQNPKQNFAKEEKLLKDKRNKGCQRTITNERLP